MGTSVNSIKVFLFKSLFSEKIPYYLVLRLTNSEFSIQSVELKFWTSLFQVVWMYKPFVFHLNWGKSMIALCSLIVVHFHWRSNQYAFESWLLHLIFKMFVIFEWIVRIADVLVLYDSFTKKCFYQENNH